MNKIIFLFLFSFFFSYTQEINFKEELRYLKQFDASPSEYVLSKFDEHDVVLLGEDHAIKNNIDFLIELIPLLYSKGITNLGMEFGAFEVQEKLDSLLVAPVYNHDEVRDLMYYYNVGWAYKEYTDIHYAAWKFNNSLPENAKKFRILNLSYQYKWQHYTKGTSAEEMPKVFHRGNPNITRQKVIEDEVLLKNEKVLVIIGIPHAFTSYKEHRIIDNECVFLNTTLGNTFFEKYPDKIFTIMLHAPFYNKPQKTPYILSPASGNIEAVMKLRGNKPVGFDLFESPFGKLKDNSNYSACYPDLIMEHLFDGYVFLAPFEQMQNCSLDIDFFKNKNWEKTKTQIPDPHWHAAPENLEAYWNQIKRYQDVKSRYRLLIENSKPSPLYGEVIRLKDFQSNYVAPRNIDIWLPPDYSSEEKYAVLYMHDGQMLFDKSGTWNNQEWEADETLAKLIHQQKIKKTIVVGIWNTGAYRHSEYFPEKPISLLDTKTKEKLIKTDLKGKAQADNYLKFIVKELKPHIDFNYATHVDLVNTFIAGSSMGGLISMYAVSEYPQVFGGAACLSTHWVGDVNIKGDKIPNAFNEYLKDNLPKNRKFYFDYGTKGLDSLYKPYQKMIDKTLKEKGYTKENWKTIEFQGKDHSEQSWSNRFAIPLTFLLSK